MTRQGAVPVSRESTVALAPKQQAMSKSQKFILGVDIGGTKVEAGLVGSSGAVLLSARSPMIARGNADEGLTAVCSAIDGVLRDPRAKTVGTIGVSVPGWVDSRRGTVVSATNLPCWWNYPLAQKIEERYGFPVRLANDANAAALAESMWGAGAGCENMFYVSLGTGIGAGMVLRGELFAGTTGAAGEGGHMTIDLYGPKCGCGKRGCIEMYSSGTAVARHARAEIAKSRSRGKKILRLAGGAIEGVTAETVSNAALAGDSFANEILETAADHLAIWFGGIVDLLEPERIVVGGGFAKVMMRYAPRIRKTLRVWAINPNRKRARIVKAHFQAQSALVGAAALWLPRTDTRK
jgi:glucokinase